MGAVVSLPSPRAFFAFLTTERLSTTISEPGTGYMYVYISSLLIKPGVRSEIGAIDVNQRFLVIESNFG